jgi:hypothetical protein
MKQYVLVKRYPIEFGGYSFWRSLMYPDQHTHGTNFDVSNLLYGERNCNIPLALESETFTLVLLKVKRVL